MPQNQNSQNSQPDQLSGFVKRKIESPNLNFQTSPIEQSGGGVLPIKTDSGLKGFYAHNKFYLLAIFAGGAIIAVLSFFAFRKTPPPPLRAAKVNLEILAPEVVPTGSDAVFQIKIHNLDSQKLIAGQLELTYPSGLAFQNSNVKPENLSRTLFKVPDLISGQDAVIILKAKASGGINENKTLSAKFTYKYSNFNSEFAQQQAVNFRLTASNVAVEISGPVNITNAQIGLFAVKYKNNSADEIKGARIKLIFPAGFNFASATPAPDLGDNIWNIGNMPKNGEGAIEFLGSFKDAAAGESKTFLAELLVLGKNGDYFLQSQSNFTASLSSLPLLVSQSLPPQETDNVYKPGDTLAIAVSFQNNGNTAANGVNIVAALDGKVLDLSTLKSEGGQISGSTITWNAAGVRQLESLQPSESGTVSFSVRIKNPAAKDSSKNLTASSSVKIKANEYQTYFPGNDLSVKISSPAALSKALRYVSGSLPPSVGKNTLYKASLTLANSSNDFTDGLLTAFVVSGTGGFVQGSVNAAEANRVDYDSSTNKLTWKVGGLSAHAGKFNPPRVLEFGLNFTPSASQVGDSPILLKDIRFSGKDSFTGEMVNLAVDDIRTDDLPGANSYRDGRVEE